MRDLRAFLARLRAEKNLVEITGEVDPDLELPEIHRRVIAAGGPALLFQRVKGHSNSVVTNLFGTSKRVDLAFGPRPEAFVRDAVRLSHELVPPTLAKVWGARGFLGSALAIGTKNVRRAPVMEVVDTPGDLGKIPMLRSWPEDGGFFVTLPLVYTENPADGRHNLGMYRVQRHGPGLAGMHWQIGKGGGYHHHVARQSGEDLPTAVFVGGPPALIVSAIAPLPENVPELLLASLLLGEKLRMTPSPVGPLRLVADCEAAIVGRVPPFKTAPEGPFGDHYGYYSLRHEFPVLEVDAVCTRRDFIWPATVVGKPRQEDAFIGDYLQRLLAPLFPLVMPNVRDLWSYGETGYHALSACVVEERHPREALSAALRVLGEGQLALTKFLWVLGSPVDLTDAAATLEHLLARFHPETDLVVLSHASMDTLDYTGPAINHGSKGIMLGLGAPWRELPRALPSPLPAGVRAAALFCGGCLVVDGPTWAEDPTFAERVAQGLQQWPLIVLVDDAIRVAAHPSRFLWTTFTRFEPAADLFSSKQRIHRNHVVHEGALVIDARMKPSYPTELHADPDTANKVSSRWAELFPAGGVEMGDSEVAHLDDGHRGR